MTGDLFTSDYYLPHSRKTTMACHQQLTFVLSVVWMCFIAGAIARRSCPTERPTVDICTEGTVQGTETLLVDFSPEAGITSCNCNFTIDGVRVNVSTLVAPQSQCEPQLEIELGIDYIQAGCTAFIESYNIPEIKTGIIWTTADAFYGNEPPQDLCLEFNVEGGTSMMSVTCNVERDQEPSTATDTVTLTPEVLPAISGTTDPIADQKTNTSEFITTTTVAKALSGPPDSIRDEILKLAKNDENPVVFEDVALSLNATDLLDATLGETTSDVTASSTTTTQMLPPKDVMEKILDVANATSNPIRIEFPSTTPLQNDKGFDVLTSTTSLPQPIETSVRNIPVVPPTDVMDQLLNIANNGTSDAIVFPEFQGGTDILDTVSPSTQVPEQTSMDVGSKTISTTQQQTTDIYIDTTTLPVAASTTPPLQQTTDVDIDTTSLLVAASTTKPPQQQTTDAAITTSMPIVETSTNQQISTQQLDTTTAQEKTTILETTSKKLTKTTTPTIYSATEYDHTPYNEVPADDRDWAGQPDSSTPSTGIFRTTKPVKTAYRGDIEITTQRDLPEVTSLPETISTTVISVTTQTDDITETTTVPSTNDVTGARNDTRPDNRHGAEDTLVVIVVGSIIGIIVIVAVIAIIRAFCKSRRKSANITMMEKGGLENGSGATTGIDNPLVQLQQEQEMVETNPNPVIIESGTEGNNGKMEANFSEGAEMNGNGVSNSPKAGDDGFQSSENH